MFSVMCGGWQELVSRYWHLSVGFLYKSTTILLFTTDVDVSKNARNSDGLQSQDWVSLGGVVWLIVNLIVGCKRLSSSRNKCNFSTVPVHRMNISYKKLFQALIVCIPSKNVFHKLIAN